MERCGVSAAILNQPSPQTGQSRTPPCAVLKPSQLGPLRQAISLPKGPRHPAHVQTSPAYSTSAAAARRTHETHPRTAGCWLLDAASVRRCVPDALLPHHRVRPYTSRLLRPSSSLVLTLDTAPSRSLHFTHASDSTPPAAVFTPAPTTLPHRPPQHPPPPPLGPLSPLLIDTCPRTAPRVPRRCAKWKTDTATASGPPSAWAASLATPSRWRPSPSPS